MDMKLILVLLMGLIGLGYAIPRVRRNIMEPVAMEDAMDVFAIEPEDSDEDFEGAEMRFGGYHGNRGGYGGLRGGYGGHRGGYGGHRGGYGGHRGGYGGHRGGHGGGYRPQYG